MECSAIQWLPVPCPQPASARMAAVYVFVKPTSGWHDLTETAKLTEKNGALYDKFGASVAINGGTIITTCGGDTLATTAPGAVCIYTKPLSGWTDTTESARLIDGTGTDDAFGSTVAINGNTVVAGAPRTLYGPYAVGATYVFLKPSGGWGTTSTFAGPASRALAHAN